MANMLRKKTSGSHGCCDSCARGKPLHLKPGPRERHQARAIEKRQWRKDESH
jgi:hypothetical protein